MPSVQGVAARDRIALACLALLAVAAYLPGPAGPAAAARPDAAAMTAAAAAVAGTATAWAAASALALLAFAACGWHGGTRAARVFAVLAVVALGLVAATGREVAPVLAGAARQGAQFATLLAALATLRLPMRRSALVGRAAAFLLACPARGRYAALAFGSHFLTPMFGVGLVSLIGDMMARGGLDCRRSATARQMLLAVIRGLAFATLWSPMAMSFAIVSTALPTLDPLRFVGVGLLAATGLLLLSCLLQGGLADAHAAAAPAPPPGGGLALATIAGMSLLLFLLTWALHAASGLSFLLASALTLPAFSLAWLLLERTPSSPHREGRGKGAAASAWPTLLARAILELRSETVVFAASAFIGQAVLALLMPAHAPAGSLALPVAAWPFALLCVLAIPLVSALAVAPTVAVLLLAQAIAASGVGAERPLTFAIALTAGWSVAIGVSTVSATLLIASRVSALPASEIALGWNRNFTLLMLPLAMGLVSLLYVLGW